MKRALAYLLTGCLLVLAHYSAAQNVDADSLRLLLKTDKEDTAKVHHLIELGWSLMESNPDTAILLGNEALAIVNKATLTLQWKKLKAATLGNLGVYYRIKANYPIALEYFLSALKLDEEVGNKQGMSFRLGNIGLIHWTLADYPKALDYYFRALKFNEELGDKGGISRLTGNIGLVYADMGDYKKSLEYYFKALKLAEELGKKNAIARHVGNIGNTYVLMEDYPKALEYYLNALKLRKELGAKNLIATTLGNIGILYSKAPNLPPIPGENKTGYALAEKYLLDALQMNIEIGAKDAELDNYTSLSSLYEKTGKHQLALEHYKKAMALKDTIFSEQRHNELTRKELTYEFEKKEAATKAEQALKDEQAKAEANKQRIILLAVAGGLLLVVVFLVFVFRSLRITQKQKQIIEQQKHTVEEKQKEILDSIRYAKRIQLSLLPTEKYVDRKLRELKK